MDSHSRNETPEQLIDVFKAAALSVTKLYKSSVAAETRARSEGYQECLDDLLGFLDRESSNSADGNLSKLKRWIAERREGGDATLPTSESEDEVDKGEANTQSEPVQNTNISQQAPAPAPAPTPARTTSDSPAPVDVVPTESPRFIVPSQDTFTFGSEHQYPNIATLDLSDSRSHASITHHTTRQPRNRNSARSLRASSHLGRGAGAKRRMDFDDFFGGCFGGKDTFGNGAKRSRHM